MGNGGSTTRVALSEPNNTIDQAVNSGLSSANPGTFIGSGSIRANNNAVVIGSSGVNANLGDLNSGESATVNLSVKSVVAGDIITTTNATSSETDRNFLDNSLITSTTVNPTIPTSADLELTQTVSNTNPNLGDRINFTLNLTNKGPGIASGIKVTDFVPSGLSFVSASPEQGTYDSNTGVWDVGNVRDNLTRSLSITANVVSGGRIVNTAEVTGVNEADPDSTPGNNNPNEDDQATVTLLVASNDINGTPGRDTLNGTSANERITGFEGADILTGGAGNDEFIYTSFRDAGDIITDFVAGADKIVLTQLFQSLNLSLNYGSANQQGYLSFATQGDNTSILIDPDGSAGRARPTPFITVQGVSQNTLASAGNFVF